MEPVVEHRHLHKFLRETELMVYRKCDCGDTMTESKSQISILPMGERSIKQSAEKVKLSSSYRRRIFGLASYIPLDNEELHQLVLAETGEEHISLLTIDQAMTVISKLQSIWNKMPDRISDKQLAKVYKLGYLLRWKKVAIITFVKGSLRNLMSLSSQLPPAIN